MASAEFLPSRRSTSRAKSTHQVIPFFLTIPISRMIPIIAMRLSSVSLTSKVNKAPTRRGQGGEDSDGGERSFHRVFPNTM